MGRGDWLSVPGTYGAYQHHGIDLGDGRVCHYTSDLGQFAARTLNLPGHGDVLASFSVRSPVLCLKPLSFRSLRLLTIPCVDSSLNGTTGAKQPVQAEIQIQSMSEFTGQGLRPVTVVRQCMSHDDGDHIVYRALSCLGERKYDLLFNNCEHFACWAFTGEQRKSEQVCG